MARQRFIWPSIWKDPVFGRLRSDEQILFIGLFSIADDEGRMLADPAYLRAEIFPYKNLSEKKMETLKRGLVAKCANVELYEVDGIRYLALLKWVDYQKPKYPKASKIPPPFPQNGEGLTESGSQGWVGLGRDGMGRALPPGEGVTEAEFEEGRKALGILNDKLRKDAA